MAVLSLMMHCYSDRYGVAGIGIRDTVERDEPFLPVEQDQYNAALSDTKVFDLLPQALSICPSLPRGGGSIVRL